MLLAALVILILLLLLLLLLVPLLLFLLLRLILHLLLLLVLPLLIPLLLLVPVGNALSLRPAARDVAKPKLPHSGTQCCHSMPPNTHPSARTSYAFAKPNHDPIAKAAIRRTKINGISACFLLLWRTCAAGVTICHLPPAACHLPHASCHPAPNPERTGAWQHLEYLANIVITHSLNWHRSQTLNTFPS